MLPFNTMRYATDVFYFEESPPIKALLVSKVALSTTGYESVKNIIIQGNSPYLTNQRFMFKIDNKIYRFVNGALVEYTNEVNVDNVLNDGNTKDDLNTLSNLSVLLNKDIYPIIAISSPIDVMENPTVKFAMTVISMERI